MLKSVSRKNSNTFSWTLMRSEELERMSAGDVQLSILDIVFFFILLDPGITELDQSKETLCRLKEWIAQPVHIPYWDLVARS